MSATSPATPPALETAPLRGLRREFLHLAPLLLCLFLMLVLVRLVLFETVPVNGPSMDPTLHDGDRVLVWKLPRLLSELPLVGGFEPFETGDILVFDGVENERQRYVKRAIALGPADAAHAPPTQVRVEGSDIFVNNQRLSEPYLPEQETPSGITDSRELAQGEYYLAGDNRAVSKDSRRFGPVPRAKIAGEAIAVIWPPGRIGGL